MSVRAKFQLVSITDDFWGGKSLKFSVVYDASTDENRRFTKATPSGSLEMTIDNPSAVEQFKLGQYYYTDFTAAE